MESAALLVIDVQQGLFKRKNMIFNEDILLENINYLIDKSRDNNIPVFFIRHTNKSILLENSENWQVHSALKAGTEDLYFNKEHGNIFEEKNFVKQLESLAVKTLIVAGLITNGCVKAACLGGRDSGYKVILAEDAHSSFNRYAEKLIDEWNEKLRNEGIKAIPARSVFK